MAGSTAERPAAFIHIRDGCPAARLLNTNELPCRFKSKSDHLRISDVLSVNSTTQTWQQVFTDGPQRTACPQPALHVRTGPASLTPVEGGGAIGASEGLAALASAPLGAPSHRVRRTVERPRGETTWRGHTERPRGEATWGDHAERPCREAVQRGHLERGGP